MKGYRQIGRRNGRVTAIKDGAYGFIRVAAPFTTNGLIDEREDCYFRAAEVSHSTSGATLPADQIQPGMLLSFEILLEDTRSGPRMRAVRVRHEGINSNNNGKDKGSTKGEKKDKKPEKADKSDKAEEADVDAGAGVLVALQIGVRGRVTRDSTKREAAGSIAPMYV